MADDPHPEPPIVDYHGQHDSPAPPKPLKPLLLCTPGVLCWLLTGIVLTIGDIPFPAEPFWITLLLAIITAIVSIIRYGPRPYWWSKYVLFNLIANIIGIVGLLFTTCMLLLAA